MQPSLALERPTVRPLRISIPWRALAAAFWFVAPAVLYLALGAVLAFRDHAIIGDAWSRVGNAFYVLFSRDPHLGAIGFVWTPLPSLLVLPLLPLQAVFPGLVREGYAANIVSALAMAGAVYHMHGFLSDLRVRTSIRFVVTAIFALQPMVLLYGANGMSEALFLLFLIVTVRYLCRWVQAPTVTALVVAAVGLALAYLTRYEAVIATMAAAGVVAVVAYRRETGDRRERRLMVLAELLVLLTPVACAFIVWALASLIITGDPFPIFNSVYGNSAYVERAANLNALATGQGTPAALSYVVGQVVAMQPLLPVLMVASLAVAAWRRDSRILVIGGILGAVLAFQVFAFLTGRTYGWLRFYITAVPLGAMLVGLALAPGGDRPDAAAPKRFVFRAIQTFRWSRWPTVLTAGLLAGALAFSAIPTSWAMADIRLGRGETAEQLNGLLGRSGPGVHEQYSAEQWIGTREIAQTINDMNLPSGSVLLDSATGFPIIMQVANPRVFVITSDRDFDAALADPAAFGVQYLLMPPDFQGHDAVNRAYPFLYRSGSKFTELVTTFDAPGQSPDWRLYRVIGNT